VVSDNDRNRAFRGERTRQRRRLTAMQRDLSAEIERLLKEAETSIAARLAGAVPDYERLTLPTLQASVRAALEEVQLGIVPGLTRGADQAWQIGIDQIDLPIDAGLALGEHPLTSIRTVLPTVDTRQLRAMKVFLTDRGRNITTVMADRINSELGLSIIGTQTPSAVVPKVAKILGSGRSRALTLIRTELGRAYSAAGQERMTQAQEVFPGLQKQWRRSGKLHPRPDHVAADGQIQEVGDPFIIAGVKLAYPRDPEAPARHTINCGCDSLPYMSSWEVRNPDRLPFTDRERAANRFIRNFDGAVPSAAEREPSG
jgi:hypothetical protein